MHPDAGLGTENLVALGSAGSEASRKEILCSGASNSSSAICWRVRSVHCSLPMPPSYPTQNGVGFLQSTKNNLNIVLEFVTTLYMGQEWLTGATQSCKLFCSYIHLQLSTPVSLGGDSMTSDPAQAGVK